MLRFRPVSTPIPLSELEPPAAAQTPPAVPPPRFSGATFATYRPADRTQREACDLIGDFAREAAAPGRRRWWLPWSEPRKGNGLYLDGGYGVGKTHLLAAAFHEAAEVARAYFTFQDLVHLIGSSGLDSVRERFERVSLVCIDEFELDDPGNTLIVKRFLETLLEQGASVITTSNTPPEAQGRGRFNAEDFEREIQGIAAFFRAVRIEGPDYRRRGREPSLPSAQEVERRLQRGNVRKPLVTGDFDELLELLRRVHPIRYRTLLGGIGTLCLSRVRTIPNQVDALRFVHFIDQLYDQQVALLAWGEIELPELFDVSYRHSAYARKHERCISRLAEVAEESLSEASAAKAQGFD